MKPDQLQVRVTKGTEKKRGADLGIQWPGVYLSSREGSLYIHEVKTGVVERIRGVY